MRIQILILGFKGLVTIVLKSSYNGEIIKKLLLIVLNSPLPHYYNKKISLILRYRLDISTAPKQTKC